MITSNENRFKTAAVIVVLFLIGTLLNIPFSRELKRLKIEAGNANVKLSDSIFSDVIQTGIYGLILGLVLVFVGLWVSKKAQLGAPVIESFFSNQKNRTQPHFFKTLLYSLAFSVVLALVVLLVHRLIRAYFPVENIIERPSKPFYAIVSFSAGITEEIIFRFGLMSLIITIILFFKQNKEITNTMVWVSIIITAICFGLMHLPLSKNFSNLTIVTVSATMIGNLITGSFFGWVYWKRGLLVAIIVHIVWDLVFHVVGSPYL